MPILLLQGAAETAGIGAGPGDPEHIGCSAPPQAEASQLFVETELQSSLFQLTESHSGSEAHVTHPGVVPAGASPGHLGSRGLWQADRLQ